MHAWVLIPVAKIQRMIDSVFVHVAAAFFQDGVLTLLMHAHFLRVDLGAGRGLEARVLIRYLVEARGARLLFVQLAPHLALQLAWVLALAHALLLQIAAHGRDICSGGQFKLTPLPNEDGVEIVRKSFWIVVLQHVVLYPLQRQVPSRKVALLALLVHLLRHRDLVVDICHFSWDGGGGEDAVNLDLFLGMCILVELVRSRLILRHAARDYGATTILGLHQAVYVLDRVAIFCASGGQY